MDGNKKLFKFFFLKPKSQTNAESIAEKLIGLSDIEEVLLTESPKGYVVKTKFYNEKNHSDAMKYVLKNVGSWFGEIKIA